MKIAYKDMENVIEVNCDKITGLVIEKPEFMYKLLRELKRSIEGLDSEIVVSKDEMPLSTSKTVVCINDFINFTINQKTLLTKIITEMDKISKNEMYFERSQQLLSEIESHVNQIANEFPCEIVCEKLNMMTILKAAGIEVDDDYESLEEELLAYMDLSREYEGKSLFVFVNLRSVVGYNNLEMMMQTALTREHNVVLLDNYAYPRLSCEKRLTIDKDLCEF